MVDDKGPFVLSVFVVGYIYVVRIHIVEVYLFASLLADACRQHDVDTWFFYAVYERADTLDVCRVRHDPPRDAGEPIHALEKIVASMIADLIEPFAVRVRNLRYVRRIDDQRCAVGEYRLELLHDLARNPDVVVHLRRDT